MAASNVTRYLLNFEHFIGKFVELSTNRESEGGGERFRRSSGVRRTFCGIGPWPHVVPTSR